MADDLLSCLALSMQAPIFIAPAMNQAMWSNKVVQENCAKLKKRGISFIGPVSGKLACGSEGKGCLAKVEDIVAQVVRSLK